MVCYTINKGVGKAVEVKGLRAQYFIYAVAGVVLAFVVFFVLSFIVNQAAAIIVAAVCLISNVSVCFFLNNKYGEKGLVQVYAKRATPNRIAVHKRIYNIIKNNGD
ncbi:MAG: DUF4133 domain-containing protein [Paludibacteraceae bacterium]|nr:DUF4133 domain-containing protein [Paludibacteraceae bacterium]